MNLHVCVKICRPRSHRLFLLRESLVLVTGLVPVHNFEIGSVRAVGSPLDILRSRKQPHSREQPQSREYLPSWISIALEPDRPVEAGRLVVISPWTVASFTEATGNPLQTGLLKKTWNTRMRLKSLLYICSAKAWPLFLLSLKFPPCWHIFSIVWLAFLLGTNRPSLSGPPLATASLCFWLLLLCYAVGKKQVILIN